MAGPLSGVVLTNLGESGPSAIELPLTGVVSPSPGLPRQWRS